MMFGAAALALLVTLALILIRATLGPTVFDRAQAANSVGTVAMLLLAVMGFLDGRPEFLDLAIAYGLLNIISTIAVLKYFRQGDLGDSGDLSGAAETGDHAETHTRVGAENRPEMGPEMHPETLTSAGNEAVR